MFMLGVRWPGAGGGGGRYKRACRATRRFEEFTCPVACQPQFKVCGRRDVLVFVDSRPARLTISTSHTLCRPASQKVVPSRNRATSCTCQNLRPARELEFFAEGSCNRSVCRRCAWPCLSKTMSRSIPLLHKVGRNTPGPLDGTHFWLVHWLHDY